MLGNTNLTSIMSWKLAEKDKKNSLSFLCIAVCPHKALVKLKENKTKKKYISVNLSQRGLLYKQHPALV